MFSLLCFIACLDTSPYCVQIASEDAALDERRNSDTTFVVSFIKCAVLMYALVSMGIALVS